MSETATKIGESLFSCERCGADRFGDRIQERRLIFEVAYLCWSCFKIASEDEALVRACCDCDAMVCYGRARVSQDSSTPAEINMASDVFYVGRGKSIATVKAFLAGGKKQVKP